MQFFKIGLKSTEKWLMQQTNAYSTISGECCLEKVVSIFGFGHRKTHFLVPKIGHFLQKCPFSSARSRLAKTDPDRPSTFLQVQEGGSRSYRRNRCNLASKDPLHCLVYFTKVSNQRNGNITCVQIKSSPRPNPLLQNPRQGCPPRRPP